MKIKLLEEDVNVNEKSNIMLTKIGKALTGVIIKRALPKEAFVNIITDSIDNI